MKQEKINKWIKKREENLKLNPHVYIGGLCIIYVNELLTGALRGLT